jgi:T4-like virus tail tube protein gp19
MPELGLNAALGFAAKLLGVRVDPYQVFNFMVEIEGIISGGFSECSGPTKYPPLVLKHGLTLIDGLWRWHQDVAQGKVDRRNGSIYLLDRQGLPVMWWDFKKAFPVKWTGPELRAASGEVAFESIELAHRGLSRPELANLITGIGAEVAGAISGSIGF